ncbi:unnamed protein product [Didymodactylos carnosus]|uniref:CAP-Gly domain-containing protein n=1 Tax=Didymodactylos carnosus TaxID=1234261 RepID=A0A813QIK6_9BILA|nr:unnamed protein product [Didymodactylos carnosus]CAF3549298.1 unnamed protein product [Didymodactylos carnosus]
MILNKNLYYISAVYFVFRFANANMSKLPVNSSRIPATTPSKIATSAANKAPSIRAPQQQSNSGADDTTANVSYKIGDRVLVNGTKPGTIAFLGATKFSEGQWAGVILDQAQGKNDGSYEGHVYFNTEPNRGIFCRPAKLAKLQNDDMSKSTNSSITSPKNRTISNENETSSTVTSNLGNSTSTIGAGDSTLNLNETSAAIEQNERTLVSEDSSTTENKNPVVSTNSNDLKVGDRVIVSGTKSGILRYLGTIHVADGIWCGVQLDEPLGKNDGSVSGKRYFKCEQRYGLFSPVARVEKISLQQQKQLHQPITPARQMSITSASSRLNRTTSQESLQSNLSEYSTSSNSVSRIPTYRTPSSKTAALKNTATTPFNTANTKTLLTQAAASLATQVPSQYTPQPSSNTNVNMPNLLQTLKEREMYIEQLHHQRDQERLEFSRAAQQVDDYENRMLLLKNEYDLKQIELETLKKEDYTNKQRLEDLEFQLEEYKLNDTTKEQSLQHEQREITIPEGHRLLTPNDILLFEQNEKQIKGKLVEFEQDNQMKNNHINNLEKKHNDQNQQVMKKTRAIENSHFHLVLYFLKVTSLTKQCDDLIKSNETLKNELDNAKQKIMDIETIQQEQKEITIPEGHRLLTPNDILLFEQNEEKIKAKLVEFEQDNQMKNNQINNLEKKHNDQNQQVSSLTKQCDDLIKSNETLKNELDNTKQKIMDIETNYHQQLKEKLEQHHANELDEKQKELNEKQNEWKQSVEHEKELIKTELKIHYEQIIETIKNDYEQKLTINTKQINDLSNDLTRQKENIVPELERRCEQLKKQFIDLQNADRANHNEREIMYENQLKENQLKFDEYEKVRHEHDLILTNLKQSYEEEQSSHNKTKDERNQVENNLRQMSEKLENSIKEQQLLMKNIQNENQLKFDEYEKNKHENEMTLNQLKELYEQEKLTSTKIKHEHENLCQKMDELQKINESLQQTNESLQQTLTEKEGSIETIHQQKQVLENIKKEYEDNLRKKTNEHEQEMHNLKRQCEELINLNENLKSETNDLHKKLDDLDKEYHQQLMLNNEQVKTSGNEHESILKDKQTEINNLTSLLNDTQKANIQLEDKYKTIQESIEKIRQEEKQHLDKVLKEKLIEYETNQKLLKSEYSVEQENLILEHDQEKIKLKTQIQQLLQAGSGGGKSSNTSNIKQLEYELNEAKYQIDKLQGQLKTKDSSIDLEKQIEFSNSVISDLRNENEKLKKDLIFAKNPFVTSNETIGNRDENIDGFKTKTLLPRLYCDMCEVFDQHDTDDCPKQSSITEEHQNHTNNSNSARSSKVDRLYCAKCEEFDHVCDDADPDETF